MNYIPVSVRHKNHVIVGGKTDNHISVNEYLVPWRSDSPIESDGLRPIWIYRGTQFKQISRDLLRVNHHDRLVEQTNINYVTWRNTISYCVQAVIALTEPYLDPQELNVSQGRAGSSRLRILPSIGMVGGPGGSGGCEWLPRYFRYQVKPTSTKADVAMYNPLAGPALNIARNVLKLVLTECYIYMKKVIAGKSEAIRCEDVDKCDTIVLKGQLEDPCRD